jgi:plastocyanin
MNKLLLFMTLLLTGFIATAQQTFIVTASGLTFSPATVNATVGDKVSFNVSAMHPVREVTEATFLANGSTALSGGFSFPSGVGEYTLTAPGTLYYICVNHISSGMKGKIVVSAATKVENQVSSSDFDVYPNPADDYIFIKNPDNSNPKSVSVFDMSGKMLLKSGSENTLNDKTTVYVSDLRKGMYFIMVSYPGKTYTRKFIKM